MLIENIMISTLSKTLTLYEKKIQITFFRQRNSQRKFSRERECVNEGKNGGISFSVNTYTSKFV